MGAVGSWSWAGSLCWALLRSYAAGAGLSLVQHTYVINFCPALLDVLALICLPWMIVAAICRGCIILLATGIHKLLSTPLLLVSILLLQWMD
ncbi:hypothetical protein Nepgr_017403 [Nepenthes gracilis]|uniref:Uncharacterized protein n=1 Tax=Nepenthes gracilis TaxID=150966 RepID=A0AAD3SR30_NEPGR|nr:hypothetical protein Nepgr_017403 [Nepenthes gracilis]